MVNLPDTIGYIAAACTTLSFIPQILKIRKEGGAGVSYAMLFIYLFGLLLWLAYGILRHADVVVAANAASAFLVALAIVAKAISAGHLSHLSRIVKSRRDAVDRRAQRIVEGV